LSIVHFVIMGCGRTGAWVAADFESRGHSVAVIDQVGDAFRRLPDHFTGQRVVGIGFDRSTLEAANVQEAYGFAALSDGDNSNILAARVAKETYGVAHVIARVSDSGRADVFRRLGIGTVAQVPWTASQVASQLLPSEHDEVFSDAGANISVRRVALHVGWVGHPYERLQADTGAAVAFIVRFGEGLIPAAGTLIQQGDEPHLSMRADQWDTIKRAIAKAPRKS